MTRSKSPDSRLPPGNRKRVIPKPPRDYTAPGKVLSGATGKPAHGRPLHPALTPSRDETDDHDA